MKKILKRWAFYVDVLQKPLRIMRWSLFLFIMSIFQAQAISGFAQKTEISLNLKNASVATVLSKIEDNSNFYFMCNRALVDIDRTISIQVDNQLVEKILAEIFKGTDVKYVITGRQIVLTSGNSNSEALEGSSSQQPRSLSGKITDSSGSSLPGVSVVVKGTTQGTITDANGNYSLANVPANATLQFSFIGMKSQEITIGNNSIINVALTEETIEIEEVVAIGYGTQKRKSVTSSIATVKSEDFNSGAVSSSVMQLIQGKIAGLAISRNNGTDPNSEVEFQLRGLSSVNSDQSPLIVVDGVPGGSLNSISPEDIASIDVLRDGSSAAIYGTRANNGVVIITTKRGKPGQLSVEYSAYAYTESISKRPDILSGSDYRQVIADLIATKDTTKIAQANNMKGLDRGFNTDWFKEITRKMPISQVHNIAISGGTDKTTYRASVNYRDLKGIILRSSNQVTTGHLNITQLGFNDKLKMEFDLSSTFRTAHPADYNAYRFAVMNNPTYPVRNQDGTYYETTFDQFNPVGLINLSENDQQYTNILAHVRGTYEIIKGLKLSTLLAMEHNNQLGGTYEYIMGHASQMNSYGGAADRQEDQWKNRTVEATLNYNLNKGSHTLDLLGGYSYQDFTWEMFGAANKGFVTDAFTYNNLEQGDYSYNQGNYNTGPRSDKNASTLIAFFGRANYSYNDKYLLQASIRREGSSKFGANDKWGMFPAVSVGWRISKENFMSNLTFINDLKLRFGYGVTGNSGISPYQSLLTMSGGSRFLYNGNYIRTYGPASNPNPDLRWERKAETNIGLDLTILKGNLTASLDLYNRKTSDLLFSYDVPVPPNLYNSTLANVGDMSNKGIELTIHATPVKTSNFSWTTDFNISYNKNEMVSMSNGIYKKDYIYTESLGDPGLGGVQAYRVESGQPIGNMYGYRYAGLDADGKWLVYDHKGNMISALKANLDSDRYIIGNGLPKMYMGFTNTFRYKNIDFSFMLRGAYLFDIINTQRLFFENVTLVPHTNILRSAMKSQLYDNPVFSSYYIEKGDYTKLDNVTLGYNFKSNKYFKNARVYVSGANLLTFTKYKGIDPEISINGLAPGIDRRTAYPRTRTFTIGLNVTL